MYLVLTMLFRVILLRGRVVVDDREKDTYACGYI